MTDQAMSPLRRRMIEDMTIRKFAPKTQHDYLKRVKNFTIHLGRSPDTASSEDVRRYQLHLTASGSRAEAAEPKPLSHRCPCCGGRMIVIETFQLGEAPRYRPAAATAVIRIDTS